MPRPAEGPPLSREENRRRAVAGVHAIFERYKLIQAQRGVAYDNATMDNATILDASIGPPYDIPTLPEGVPPPPNTGIVSSCTSRIFIGPELGNYNGVMHGGAAGVIFDMLTTIALGPIAKPNFWSFLGGVSRTINLSFLKGVPIIHAYVYQVGRQAAYIKGWMTSEDGKTTYAVCDHHKIHVPTPKDNLAVRVSWDDLWDEHGNAKAGPKL